MSTEPVLLKFALPKGRMQESVTALLAEAGVKVKVGERSYRPTISIPAMDTKILKPQNIIVTPADFAYLVDFGIAEAEGERRLTMEGTKIGSLAYMAPERFTDDQSTAATDTYSLACVLYEALTGDTPFPARSMEQIIAAHVSAPPPRVSAVNPRVPAALDEVIARGMAKEPDDRYGSASALGRAAHRALTGLDRVVSPEHAANLEHADSVGTAIHVALHNL